MAECIEANFDLLYLLKISTKKYNELHLSEINTLIYLSQLLSVYDSHNIEEWEYYFSYHSLGGPYCSEIINEINDMVRVGTITRTEIGEDYYTIINFDYVNNLIESLIHFGRFKWRINYLNASLNACLTKTLPSLSRAIKQEPAISKAIELNKKIILHKTENDNIYDYFRMLNDALGNVREDILIPASIFIDYLLLLSDKQQEDIND